MKVREFKHKEMEGQKWVVRERVGGGLTVDMVPFSLNLPDWGLIDKLKAENKLEYIREYTESQ